MSPLASRWRFIIARGNSLVAIPNQARECCDPPVKTLGRTFHPRSRSEVKAWTPRKLSHLPRGALQRGPTVRVEVHGSSGMPREVGRDGRAACTTDRLPTGRRCRGRCPARVSQQPHRHDRLDGRAYGGLRAPTAGLRVVAYGIRTGRAWRRLEFLGLAEPGLAW